MSKDHIQTTPRQISPGRFWASENREVVRIVSHKPPFVRYACHSYDGQVCKTTVAKFLEHYRPISEEMATHLLKQPCMAHDGPKLTVIPDGLAEELWRSGEAYLKSLTPHP